MGHSVEARKQRWADLLEKPTGGRKFVFRIGVRTPEPPPVVRAWPWLKAERIEAAWQAYLRMLDRAEWLDDDLVPYLPVNTGTEIFAEALGCEVYRPDDNNPFAIPFVKTARDAERIKTPRLEDTPLMLLFEIADELRRRGGPDALLKMVDMQSPMDIVAQIWDKTDLFVAMLETPDAVIELAAKARTLQMAFLDAWFGRYGAEHIAHYPDYYVRKGVTMSVDEVGSVNSADVRAVSSSTNSIALGTLRRPRRPLLRQLGASVAGLRPGEGAAADQPAPAAPDHGSGLCVLRAAHGADALRSLARHAAHAAAEAA